MPLMKGKSKKAFSKNVEIEMKHGKPQDQALAIAYSVKRKSKPKKKMAHGGSADEGPSEKANQSGVHKIAPNYDKKHSEVKHGQSEFGLQVRSSQSKSPNFQGLKKISREEAIKAHKKVLDESRQIKPKLQGLAEGGSVKSQKRPMPDDVHNDSHEVSLNRGNKPAHNDSWTDNSTIKQAQANNSRKIMPIKHPKMVPQNSYSVRLRDEEDHLQSSASPGRYDQQPPAHDNEEGPDRQGPDVSDMASQHNNGKKPYNKAIEDQYAQDMAEADMKRASSYARGGPVMQPKDHGIELMEREDEAHLQDREEPSEDEGSSEAHSLNEERPNRQGDDVPDMEEQHNSGRKPYAKGGHIQFDDALDYDHDMELNPAHDKHSPDDSEDQPEDEADMEHEDSIAAAIMAKKERGSQRSGSPDDDHAVMAADGGILSHDSIYSDDSDQADIERNAEEDANEEDQLSFNSLRKENYSESEGLRQMDSPDDSAQHSDDEEMDSHDEHDMVDQIRSKMKSRRQFKQR